MHLKESVDLVSVLATYGILKLLNSWDTGMLEHVHDENLDHYQEELDQESDDDAPVVVTTLMKMANKFWQTLICSIQKCG